ncbi:oxygenase MpaB family protein [Saccharopolyspora sp. TS4A08]|uniref:Oxygenase MpaB family protein n=1 Tax=Saccharopolyspora ipomoeae TaxID=3042027 RepID=A0ABT6PUZ7_9PSEU|nr:oxygenase MpaB family protein [Saccharopolyspora sp. TS4A08]MDI2031832.1 oxygenase MpaB family protein [Saccharopolyspora sp. TS4A08]
MPEPLGPDSLMWRYFGDWRGLLLALWAGSMQNMHPQLGAGVEEHSEFFDERWERLYRSLYPIGGVVYDGPRAAETAKLVRGFHNGIKGVDKRGRPYHALNPETFFWAHATFLVMPILINERLGTPLSEAEKAQVYAEGVQWYRLYGMSMRPVPEDWPSFQRYWDRMCREELEVNQATLDVRDVSRIGKPPLVRWLPDPLWRLLRPPTVRLMLWLTTGCYDPPVREKLGLRWTRRDELLLRVGGRAFGALWKLVPFRFRYHPRARAAWQRAQGRRPIDAPLVETPPRNYPPVDKRGDPKHYFPANAG